MIRAFTSAALLTLTLAPTATAATSTNVAHIAGKRTAVTQHRSFILSGAGSLRNQCRSGYRTVNAYTGLQVRMYGVNGCSAKLYRSLKDRAPVGHCKFDGRSQMLDCSYRIKHRPTARPTSKRNVAFIGDLGRKVRKGVKLYFMSNEEKMRRSKRQQWLNRQECRNKVRQRNIKAGATASQVNRGVNRCGTK